MLGWPGWLPTPPSTVTVCFPPPSLGKGGTPERPPPATPAGDRQMLTDGGSPQRLWMRAHTGACECAGRQQAQSRAHRRTVGHSMCTMRSNSARSAQCAWYRARAQGGELQTAAHRCVRATLRRLTGGVLSPFAIWRGQAAGVSQHQATPAHSAAAQGQPPPPARCGGARARVASHLVEMRRWAAGGGGGVERVLDCTTNTVGAQSAPARSAPHVLTGGGRTTHRAHPAGRPGRGWPAAGGLTLTRHQQT